MTKKTIILKNRQDNCFHHWKYECEYSKTWNLHRCTKCGKTRTVNKKHDGNKI